MNNRTLVKVNALENGLTFRTISSGRKSPRCFYILKETLSDFLSSPRTALVVNDIYSFAELRREPTKGLVQIRFSWLSGSDYQISGWAETVTLKQNSLLEFAKAPEGTSWKLLSIEERGCPRLVFHDMENIRAALSNKRVRHKLAQFLKSNFHWTGTEQIGFYNDIVPYSFFFQEIRNGKPGVCGCVILHGQEDMRKAYYAIHT